jgi:hypothetical protein
MFFWTAGISPAPAHDHERAAILRQAQGAPAVHKNMMLSE